VVSVLAYASSTSTRSSKAFLDSLGGPEPLPVGDGWLPLEVEGDGTAPALLLRLSIDAPIDRFNGGPTLPAMLLLEAELGSELEVVVAVDDGL